MRQGQQNRRGRGRNRKSQNPLTRSFESNGPDVKIRGTPAHIAEKYISLARDAQSSSDPVLAESYLQHAEHYNRIIMAFREQQIQQGGDPNQLRRQPGPGDVGDADDMGDDGDDDAFGVLDIGPGVMSTNEPQPNVRGFEQSRQHEHGRNRGDFQFRQGRDRQHGGGRSSGDQRHHGEMSQGGEPVRQDHQPRREHRENRENREHREHRENRQERQEQGGRRGGGEMRPRRDFGAAAGEQPEFLRRSVRRPRRPHDGEQAPEPAAIVEDNAE